MDTQPSFPEAFGRFVGASLALLAFVLLAASILRVSWNNCVPQVFGGQEVNLQQSLAIIGVAWTLTATMKSSRLR